MGIVQDNEGLLRQPDVNVTDYGAEYVKAATETPVSGEPDAEETPSASDEPAVVQAEEASQPKRKQRRSRKSS